MNTNTNFFWDRGVEKGCGNDIKTIFRTLLLRKGLIQQDLADYCSVDKSYISKVCNGHYEPDTNMKLKISRFFGCDSRLIWRDIKSDCKGEDKRWQKRKK